MKRNLSFWLAASWLCLLGVTALLADATNSLHPDLASRLAPPSSGHWLGTDELGRDLLARVAFGTRHTLAVTGGASLIAVAFGILFGVAGAWRRGWIDGAMGMAIDFLWAVPVVVVVTLVVTVFGMSTGSLILAIGGISWVTSARIFRAETLRLRNGESLRTAKSFGFGPWRLLATHLAPQLRPVFFTVLGLCAVETLSLETGLAFLGLRLPPPTPTWGGMLADGAAYLGSAWWIVAIPSISIIFTLASMQVLASRAAGPEYHWRREQ